MLAIRIGEFDTYRRLALTHLQVGQRNHPKQNVQKILDITVFDMASSFLLICLRPARVDIGVSSFC